MTNIWTQEGLVNGELGEIIEIVYSDGCKPPQLPLHVATRIDNYSGPPWDKNDP